MPIIEITSWIIEASSLKVTVEALVKQGANLSRANLRGANFRGADLYGANLSRANLSGANLGNLVCIADLSDAIDLAPMIWADWQKNGIDKTRERFGLYKAGYEERALIAMCPDLKGGFCFVLSRREIWWWQWKCPNPDTVPVLWKEAES